VIDLIKKVAQNVAISLDYYYFLQLQACKSSPIDEKSPNLVTLHGANPIKVFTAVIYKFS
jgi:hypothetical protein